LRPKICLVPQLGPAVNRVRDFGSRTLARPYVHTPIPFPRNDTGNIAPPATAQPRPRFTVFFNPIPSANSGDAGRDGPYILAANSTPFPIPYVANEKLFQYPPVAKRFTCVSCAIANSPFAATSVLGIPTINDCPDRPMPSKPSSKYFMQWNSPMQLRGQKEKRP
jgi:hypothetical protein